jgi:DNA repair protein RadC
MGTSYRVGKGTTYDTPGCDYEGTKYSVNLRTLIPALTTPEHEVFAMALLDGQFRLIEYGEPFRGTLTQASVYPREVIKMALAANAAAVIIGHNHPSGRLEPSQADLTLTRHLKQALSMVDIRLLDHILVAANKTLSFAERGHL